MPTVLEAVGRFLTARKTACNSDLVDRWSPAIETQCSVKKGQPVEGRRNTWTDGTWTWWPIRVPKDSDTEPHFRDYMLDWPPDLFVTDIGTTGFDWRARRSRWTGADIDAILTHGKGLPPEEVERILNAVGPIPYVEARRSTGGVESAGLHLYMHFAGDGIPCENHTFHAALGRAALDRLAADTGLDLQASVDVCGGNLWFWSVRASDEKRSYELLKPASEKLSEADVPNWRDHILVATRKTSVFIPGVPTSEQDELEELCAAYPVIKPDAIHKRVMDELHSREWPLVYIQERNCYQTHVAGLKEVFAALKSELKLKGTFSTASPATDRTEPNCFFFLRPDGALFVVRFGAHTAEDESWGKTANGWPCRDFNVPVDPRSILDEAGVRGERGWTFRGNIMAAVARFLGVELPELPARDEERVYNASLIGNKLLVTTDRKDKEEPEGWAMTTRRLSVVLSIEIEARDNDRSFFDGRARHVVVCDDGEHRGGGYFRRNSVGWVLQPAGAMKASFQDDGMCPQDAAAAVGNLNNHPWFEINAPFEREFQAGRRWNRRGAQLRFSPAVKTGPHPHWDMILQHCGEGADTAVAANEWCNANGIHTGADYLLKWITVLLRRPTWRLPYMYLCSKKQKTGKSTLHRAVHLLFARGSVDVKLALAENFNLKLAGAVFCWVEDTHFDKKTYYKVKQLVDADTITIREMHRNAYTLPNFCHFMQSGNSWDDFYIETEDTRATLIEVAPLLVTPIDWQGELRDLLEQEAPNFLATVFSTSLPPKEERTTLPALDTEAKHLILAEQARAENPDPRTLYEAIMELVRPKVNGTVEKKIWTGSASELILKLGRGVWSMHPSHFSHQLKEIVESLDGSGVKVTFPAARMISIVG